MGRRLISVFSLFSVFLRQKFPCEPIVSEMRGKLLQLLQTPPPTMLLYQCLCQQWCQSVLVLMVMSVLVDDVCACVCRGVFRSVCGPTVSETQGGAAAQTQ